MGRTWTTPGSILSSIGIQCIMSSNANTWSEPEQFDLYIKKFRSLFEMHHVAFGSPEDFPHFMVKLAQDRHFAMDFWALTGTLSKREGGELSVEQMLAVIAEAVIDGPVPDGDDGVKTLVDELAMLLAGVDLYSPSRLSDDEDVQDDVQNDAENVETVLPPVSSPVHNGSHTRFADMVERAANEVPLSSPSPVPATVGGAVASNQTVASDQGRFSSPAATVSPAVAVPPVAATVPVAAAPAAAVPAAVVQHQFDETLMRLELTSIELKEHLEDLDKKMSQIVPHLEALTSDIHSTERRGGPAQEPLDEAFAKSVRKPAENPRLVLEPREEPPADKHDGPPIPMSLAGYSQRSGHSGLVAFMAILLLLIVGGVVSLQRYEPSLWQRVGVTLRERYDALLEKMHGANTGQAAATPASQTAVASTVSGSSPAATTASDGGSSVDPQAPSAPMPSASAPLPNSALEPTVPEHAAAPASVEPQAVDTRSNPRSGRKTHPAYSATVEKAALDQASAGDDEIGTINVAPSVMEANLVASRVPAYPETAKEAHIEGPVVVQAIISKDGFVDHVHVIQGNPRLRSAATEAVQKWRYKPYLLNGKPVEVATTITVDFTLDDW
jgi:TonB family protein